MLINQTDFIATQLQQIVYPNITAITETGASITIQTNQKQRDDPAFWQSISAILKPIFRFRFLKNIMNSPIMTG